jgi:hypothetical protein
MVRPQAGVAWALGDLEPLEQLAINWVLFLVATVGAYLSINKVAEKSESDGTKKASSAFTVVASGV